MYVKLSRLSKSSVLEGDSAVHAGEVFHARRWLRLLPSALEQSRKETGRSQGGGRGRTRHRYYVLVRMLVQSVPTNMYWSDSGPIHWFKSNFKTFLTYTYIGIGHILNVLLPTNLFLNHGKDKLKTNWNFV